MDEGLDIGALVTGLGGGLALFLFGMRRMTDGLKIVAGGGMKRLLEKLTTNRITGAIAGAVVTSVIQSSSVTTVLVVGMASAGLLTLAQSVGVILGANVGTTITAQIVAFKVTDYALALIAGGFLVELLARRERTRQAGIMVMGLGLLFFGMELMSSATVPLRGHEPFMELMSDLRNPLLGVAFGAAFTAIVQSSSATTGIVITLASAGVVTLEAGTALVLGANVGTCLTALLSALGKPREALQVALIHVLVNSIGALAWVWFIPQLADLARAVSPSAPELAGAAQLAVETPRQIANVHTIFNLANTVVLLAVAGQLARLVARLVPVSPRADRPPSVPSYLDALYLESPALALDQVRLELERLGRATLELLRRSIEVFLSGRREDIERLAEDRRELDGLRSAIVDYLRQLSLQPLIEPQPRRLSEYISAAGHFRSLGEIVGLNVVTEARNRLERDVHVGAKTREHLVDLHERACWALENAVGALAAGDVDQARAVVAAKGEQRARARAIREHLARRLAAPDAKRLEAFAVESALVEHLDRAAAVARRLARQVVESEGPVEPDEAPSDEA